MQLPGSSTASLGSHSKINSTSNETSNNGSVETKHISFSEFVATLRNKSKLNENSDDVVLLETVLQDKQNSPFTTSKRFGKTKIYNARRKNSLKKRQEEDEKHREKNTQRNIISFCSPTASSAYDLDVQDTSTAVCLSDEPVDMEVSVPKTFCLKLSDNVFQNAKSQLHLPRVDNIDEYAIGLATDHPYFPVDQCLAQFRLSHKDANGCSIAPDSKNLLWPDKYAPTSCSSLLYNGRDFARLKRWLERWKNLTLASQKPKKTERNQRDVDRRNRNKNSKGNRGNISEDNDDDDFVPQRPAAKRRRTLPIHTVASSQRPNSTGVLPHSIGQVRMPLGWPATTSSTANGDESGTDSEQSDDLMSDMDELNGEDEDEDSRSDASRRSPHSWRSTVYIILGPSGTGKTAMVYALANDLGFKVFELNPSVRRSGKDLSDQFQVALDSHHVAKEHLTSSFSTFHMTGSVKLAQQNGGIPKSRKSHSTLNFFQPRTKGTKSQKKRSHSSINKPVDLTQSEGPKGLNLSCNSLVLLDEVDVLFDSDRGFWAGLDNLLQLGRRPIVLTASDSSFLHGLSISSRICHVKPPDKKLIIPYLRSVCLSEGYQLDAAGAEILCRETVMAPRADPLVCMPASSHLDLRHLLIQLQWLSLSSPDSASASEHQSTLVSDAPAAPNPASLLTVNFDTSMLDRFCDLCPLISSLTVRTQKTMNSPVTPTSPAHKPDVAASLVDVFDEEPMPGETQSVPSVPQQNAQPSTTVATAPIQPPSVVRFIHAALKELRSLCAHWSNLEACYTSFRRVLLTHNLNAPEAQLVSSNSDAVVGLNSRMAGAGGSTAAANTRSTCTTTVNPLMTRLLAPVEPFDQSYRDLFEDVWPQTLSQWTVDRLTAVEQAVQRELGSQSQDDGTSAPTCVSNPSPSNGNLLSRSSADWKLRSELSGHGVGGPAFKQFSRCGRTALACDYLPCLRTLASGEATKQVVLNKRRFFHYFDRINLHIGMSTRDALAKPVFPSSTSY